MTSKLIELQKLEGHDDRVWHLAWSPNGEALASCSGDRTVRIWTRNAAGNWRCAAILEGTHTRTVRSCSWSPNGRLLATASFDRTVAIWEAQGDSWEHVAVLEGHENEVKAAAWNPNGNLIATCGRDKTVWVWEAAPGHEYEVVDVKHGHTQDVKTVVWHPSGEILVSASYDDSIKLWVENDDEWICTQTISGSGIGHTSTVWDVAFSPSGEYLASCSDDTTLKLWKISRENGEVQIKPAATCSGYHTRTIFSVDWSTGRKEEMDSSVSSEGFRGYIATASADNSICVFAISEQAKAASQGALENAGGVVSCQLECRKEQAHPCDVNCVRWHPNEGCLLASAGDDGCIKIWRFEAAETLSLSLSYTASGTENAPCCQ